MKMVKHMYGIRAIVKHRSNKSCGQVGSNVLDRYFLTSYFLPEVFQCINSLTLTNIEYAATHQINYYSLIDMSLFNCEFIYSNAFNTIERRR